MARVWPSFLIVFGLLALTWRLMDAVKLVENVKKGRNDFCFGFLKHLAFAEKKPLISHKLAILAKLIWHFYLMADLHQYINIDFLAGISSTLMERFHERIN